MTEIAKILTDKEKEEMESTVALYIEKVLFDAKCSEVFEIPQQNKLAFLQVTRPAWQKSRKIGWKYVEKKRVDEFASYIPIRKAERLLNFLFNFQWDSEIIKHEYSTGISKTKSGEKTVHDAFVIVKFTCNFFGKERVKTVSWSWKMYDNPAISKFAVMQAAISQATKNFAKLYGIGADLNDDIEDRFAEKQVTEATPEETDSNMKGLLEDFTNNATENE